MDIRSEPQSDLENLLKPHSDIFKDRMVLDLACYTGVSSNYLQQCGAKFVVGVDYSRMKIYDLEDSAQENILDGPVMDKGDFSTKTKDRFKEKFDKSKFKNFS